MKRTAIILWLALCAGAGAAWVDPNTNASWGVLPVQAYTNGDLASPANFFSANRHAINNMFSNRGAVVNGYVSRVAYASTDINEWFPLDPPADGYELMGSSIRIINTPFPSGATTGIINLSSTNSYIEINTAYDAPIGFSDIQIDYQSDQPIRAIADEYEPATSAPFGDHINRLYIRPTTTALVTGIRIYGYETNTYIGFSNDFAGISLRIDDPADDLSPVNLRTANRLLDAGTSNILAQTHPALWSSHPAHTITLSNGFSLSSRTNLDLLAGGVAALTVRSNRSVSVPSTLEVGTLLLGGDAWTNLADIKPADYNQTVQRIAALEGQYLDYTNFGGMMLTDGSRSISELYVAGTNDAAEMLNYSAYNTVIWTGACSSANDAIALYSTGSIGSLDAVGLNLYTLDRDGVQDLPQGFVSVDMTHFFSLDTFFYQNGRFILNPNLSGSVKLSAFSWVHADQAGLSTTCYSNSGLYVNHAITSRINLAMAVLTGRLYKVSIDTVTVGSDSASMSISFAGVTNIFSSGRRFDRYVFTRDTNTLSITATTGSSAIELDNFSILLVPTTHHAYVAGDLYVGGSVEYAGSLRLGSDVSAAVLRENGTPIGSTYVYRTEFQNTNAGIRAELAQQASSNYVDSTFVKLSAFAATNAGLQTQLRGLSNQITSVASSSSYFYAESLAVKVTRQGLVAYWDMEDGSGSSIVDRHTNGFSLSSFSGSWVFTNSPVSYRNYATQFSADGQLSVGISNRMLMPLQGTLTAWISVTAPASGDKVLFASPGYGIYDDEGYGFGFVQRGTNVVATGFHSSSGSGGQWMCENEHKTPPGFHFFCFTWTNGAAQSYMDLVKFAEGAVPTILVSYRGTNAVLCGGDYGGGSSRAIIDDVMLFNRIINTNEMQALYLNQKFGGTGLR